MAEAKLIPSNPRLIDLTGRSFGRWTAVRFHSVRNRKSYWLCMCECGASGVINGVSLTKGGSQSCGCLRRELQSERAGTHRFSGTVEYNAWCRMIGRCENANNADYEDYGGRGIAVCERWRNSFESFYADVGPRPSAKHSIDRFPDNNSGYKPGNVRWATSTQQSRNTRNNRLLTFMCRTQTVSAWAIEQGINHSTITMRLDRYGWSVADALSRRPRH